MCAALLTNEKVILNNVPHISDVLEMGHIMKDLGVDIKFNPGEKKLFIHAKKVTKNILSEKALKFRELAIIFGDLYLLVGYTGEFSELKSSSPWRMLFWRNQKNRLP